MADEIISTGQCSYCYKYFLQSEMTKHLKMHLKEMESEHSSGSELCFHINVYNGKYFLHLLVRGSSSFKTLDTFLRRIWLDCCGHLSEFKGKDMRIGMSKKFNEVLYPNLKFDYYYDFGSTTQLAIKVQGEYMIKPEDKLIFLSRNEPLKILCSNCKINTAVVVCYIHMDDGTGFYCEECIEIHQRECHDFEDYAMMPVVNSPRMGVCGYEGGSIDIQRDGAYDVK